MSKREGRPHELSPDEHIRAARLAFTPDLSARNPIRKVSEVVAKLNEEREKSGEKPVGPDTVTRAIRRAIEEGWVVVEPRTRAARTLPPRATELEQKLVELFQLDDAIVLDETPDESLTSDYLYELLQSKLGYAYAEHLAEGSKYEFRRTQPRSWGIGGGRAVRLFTQRLESLSTIERWPAQRIYSLAGSVCDSTYWIDGEAVMLDADSAAAHFAACLEDSRELHRVRHPLFVEDPSKAETRLDEFGNDGQQTVAILGAGVATLQSHIQREFEKPTSALKVLLPKLLEVIDWASGVDKEFGKLGVTPLGSCTNEWFPVKNEAVKEVPKMPAKIKKYLDEISERILCARLDDLKRADQICVLGGGHGKASVINHLAQVFEGKVSIIVTSSGSASRILGWHGRG